MAVVMARTSHGHTSYVSCLIAEHTKEDLQALQSKRKLYNFVWHAIVLLPL